MVDESMSTAIGMRSVTSVLIIEDHPFVADATACLIRRRYPQLHAVCLGSAAEALACLNTDWFRILVDLQVPGAQQLSLVRAIAKAGYAGQSCIVTAFDAPELICEARAMGLLGYILKTSAIEVFANALDAVMAGDRSFPEERTRANDLRVRLTPRQQQILELMHRGLCNRQIAMALNRTEGTVNNHITAIFGALGVGNRTQAVTRAMELRLLIPPSSVS